jgi:hypothetical protein
MGKRKTTHTDAGAKARRSGGSLSNAAGTLKAQQRKEAKAKREADSAIAGVVSRLVKDESGEGAARRWRAAYNQVRKTGVSLDDVAAVLLARLILMQDWVSEGAIDSKTMASQLGSINREIKDLADAYREQGRALPDEVAFRWVLVSGGDELPAGVVPAGKPPADAPVVETRPDVGDLLESE